MPTRPAALVRKRTAVPETRPRTPGKRPKTPGKRPRTPGENFRKRALRDRQEAIQYGSQNLVKDLLSVVDNLDRAIDHAQQSEGGDLQSLLQGVELVQRELLVVLGKHHVFEIDAMGKPFNPALHEAMAQVEDQKTAPNSIVDVLQKGYQLHDRLIRPSRVVVARGPEGEAGSGDDEGEEAAD
jgi:molecular chaperone GrpE